MTMIANAQNPPPVEQPVVRNAVRCTICQSPADRYGGAELVYGNKPETWGREFVCQKNPNHRADCLTGIFSDLTLPYEPKP